MSDRLSGLPRYATLYVGILCWIILYFVPYDTNDLITNFHVTEQVAGLIASGQLAFVALFAIVVGTQIPTRSKRKWILGGTVVAAATLLGTLAVHSLFVFVVLKFISGAGIGVIVAAFFALTAVYENPEKLFAETGIVAAVVYAGAMYLIPAAQRQFGDAGTTLIEVAIIAVGAFLSPLVPNAISAAKSIAASSRPDQERETSTFFMVLIALFVLFVSQTAYYAFLDIASQKSQLTPDTFSKVYSVSILAQLAGCLFVTALGQKAGLMKPAVFGLLVALASALATYYDASYITFIISVLAMNIGAAIGTPYVFALVSELDSSGRYAAIAGAGSNIGVAVGPAVAGFIFNYSGLKGIGVANTLLMLVCTLLVAFSARRASFLTRAEAT